MSKLMVFNNVSADGYFTDTKGDMSWAHQTDPEWQAFTKENVSSEGGILLFGRVTYEMMANYWPTPQAKEQMPEVADKINNADCRSDCAWRRTHALRRNEEQAPTQTHAVPHLRERKCAPDLRTSVIAKAA